MTIVPNHQLSLVHLPGVNATIVEWYVFASSFNGYQYCGEFEAIAALSEKIERIFLDDPSLLSQFTLSELRAFLFFEGRRYENFNRDPDENEFRIWRATVKEMEKKIRNQEIS